MSAPEALSPEIREFELPIRLTIGEREIEVPITVTVTFDELTRMVERNLGEGEELYTQLMEHYADQAAGRKKVRKPSGEPRPSARTKPAEASEAPPAESNGAAAKSRKKPAPAADFTEEELEAWRGKLPPPFTGRGKKSRDRQLWEAANPDSE